MVDCQSDEEKKISYTLLGPWEADPDKHILSFESKLAQSLMGKKVGDESISQGKDIYDLSLCEIISKHSNIRSLWKLLLPLKTSTKSARSGLS